MPSCAAGWRLERAAGYVFKCHLVALWLAERQIRLKDVDMFPRDLTDADLVLLARRAARELLAVPAWVTQRALAIADPAMAPVAIAQAGSALRQWAAALRFDSWQAQPAGALRARGAAPRQLLFSMGEHDFDLRVHGSSKPGFVQLAGQVLGPSIHGHVRWRPVEGYSHAPATAGQAALDEMGEFLVADLPAGAYILTVQIADGQVELPPLDLQPAPPV